jgi:hypothetical protein
VSFAQDAAIAADQVDAKNPSVFELYCERESDPIGRIAGGIEIDGAFNAVKAGNRQTGVVDECLVTGDRVLDRAKNRSVQDQFSAARKLFDEFHHPLNPLNPWLITRLSRTIQ